MPNYCRNILTIRDSGDSLDKVLDFIKSEERPLSFDKIIQYPQEYKDADDRREAWNNAPAQDRARTPPADGYNHGGYEWCKDNWGTKWDAINPVVIDLLGNYRVIMTFETAWVPPVQVFDALAQKFPKITIELEYFECGMEFCGGVRWENGGQTDSFRREYCGWLGG